MRLLHPVGHVRLVGVAESGARQDSSVPDVRLRLVAPVARPGSALHLHAQKGVRLGDQHPPDSLAVGIAQQCLDGVDAVHHALDAKGGDPGMPPARAIAAVVVAAHVGGQRVAKGTHGAVQQCMPAATGGALVQVRMGRQDGEGAEVLLVRLHAPAVVAGAKAAQIRALGVLPPVLLGERRPALQQAQMVEMGRVHAGCSSLASHIYSYS